MICFIQITARDPVDIACADILNELPAPLCEMAVMIAADANVSIKDVLVEAARDGLLAAKPRWALKQRTKSITANSQ